ncbi:MAG: PAS domain S-box protein, partial [Candidatus Competibacterales bacterium]
MDISPKVPQPTTSAQPDIGTIVQRIILDEFVPPWALVDADGIIQQLSGQMDRYLPFNAGPYEGQLVQLAQMGLRKTLGGALEEAHRRRCKVVADPLPLAVSQGVQAVVVTVHPVPQLGSGKPWLLVVFQDVGPPWPRSDGQSHGRAADAEHSVEQLKRELTAVRASLAQTIRDAEATTVELQLANEELRASNEELQTAQEELQASNEQLHRTYNDLESLLLCGEIAALFLDQKGCILRFTKAATALYPLIPGDIGRPLACFSADETMPPLPPGGALRPGEAVVDEVAGRDGRHYQRRVLPCIAADGRQRGMVITFNDITQAKVARQALQRSEAQARHRLREIEEIYQNAPVGLCVLDAELRFVRINQRLAEINGLSVQDHLGKTVGEVLPDWVFDVEPVLRQVLTTGLPVVGLALRGEAAAQPGVTRHWLGDWLPIRDDRGLVVGISVVAQEVTEAKRAAEEMALWRNRYATAAEASGHILYDWDPATNQVVYDGDVEGLLGFTAAQLQGDLARWIERIHPDDRALFQGEIDRVIDSRDAFDLTFRMIHKDGRVVYCEDRGRFFFDAAGNIVRMVGFIMDISERVYTRATLEVHQRAMAAAKDGILIADAQQRDHPIIYVNPAFEAITGYSQDQALGLNCRFLQGPTTDAQAIAAMGRALGEQRECQVTLLNYRRDGTPFWNDVRITPVRDPRGAVTHWVAIQTDISDSIHSQQRLRASEARYRSLIQATNAVIFQTDAQGGFAKPQGLFENYTGFDAPRQAERGWFNAFHIGDRPALEAAWTTALAEATLLRFEGRLWHAASGDYHFVRLSAVPVSRFDGAHGEWIGAIEDIHQSKLTAQALAASEARFQEAAAAAGFGTFDMDIEAGTVHGSTELKAILGLPLDAPAPMSPGDWFPEVVPPEDRAQVAEDIQRALEPDGTGQFHHDHRILRPDGSVRWVDVSGEIRFETRGAGRRAVRASGAVIDVTERKLAELASGSRPPPA